MPPSLRNAACGVATLVLLMLVPSAIGSSSSITAAAGTITAASFSSSTLGETVKYNVYLPAAYGESTKRYPVVYLLHGRGDSMSAWTQVKGTLDEMIAAGDIPATIAVMPDAPWSSRASYYVDSAYRGADPGRMVETAMINDLIPHVDASYRTLAQRDGRIVGGYSMGGYGALRWSIA